MKECKRGLNDTPTTWQKFRVELETAGFVEKNGIMVQYSDPRVGVKPDGTLIIGYHEYPEKVYNWDDLERILKEYGNY